MVMGEGFSHVAVIGLGYVGLPLTMALCNAGLRVTGIDTNPDLVLRLSSGVSHIDDVSDQVLLSALGRGLKFTGDTSAISSCDAVVICVPTPLLPSRKPDLTFMLSAIEALRAHVVPGTLVVLESTSYPGTTEEILLPSLTDKLGEVGTDFFLAFSPERIDPGNKNFSVTNTPRVIGGVTDACARRASNLYRHVVESIHLVASPGEAEMAKLLENTYRHINIALVNELAKVCHELDIDVWEVVEAAATKPFGFHKFTPGPGVGGHCIPIDPIYLGTRVQEKLGRPFEFIELANRVNESMPRYVVQRILAKLRELPLSDTPKVLLLGVTYKADIADLRESPAAMIAEQLIDLGVDVSYHDPYVPKWPLRDHTLMREQDLDAAMSISHVTVLLQEHASYDIDGIADASMSFLDTRGKTSKKGSRM